MNPEPSDNPFTPPASAIHPPPPPPPPPPALSPEKPAGGGSGVMAVVVWFFWVLLFLSYPVDALVASFQKLPQVEPDQNLVSAFAFTAFMQLSLAVFLRWLFFRFLIHEKRLRPGSWPAAAVGIVGALVIFSQIKGVEVYGFILWLQYQSWPHYLGFAIPSFICFLLVLPPWLLRRRS